MGPRARTGLSWISALFVIIVFVRSGSSLLCWQCSSDLIPECGDPMNHTEHHRLFHTKNCEATTSQHPYSYERMICRKTVQRENNRRVVIRSCAIPNPDERDITDGPCSPITSTGQIPVESCHICSTDLCNSATSASAFPLLFACGIAFLAYGSSAATRSTFFNV